MEKTINGEQKLRLCIGYAQNPANTHPCSLGEFLSVGTSQHVKEKNAHIEEAVVLSEKTTAEEQDAYDGVPMQLLINNILYEIMHLKEAPAEGTRNNRYFELARYARYFWRLIPQKAKPTPSRVVSPYS